MTSLPHTGQNYHANQELANQNLLTRSSKACIPFFFACLIAGMSWMGGGIPILTNLCFIIITLTSMICIVRELMVFSVRFGGGGILLHGGVLIWFCHDYFDNWFAADFNLMEFTPQVVAKAACLYAAFIGFMVIGLQFKLGKFGAFCERQIQKIPEPNNQSFFFVLVILMFIIGISPYFLFVSEPFYVAIYNEIVGGRVSGAAWTVGRSNTGGINYSMGAYVVQILDVGKMGSQLAAFYAVLIARNPMSKLLCGGIWFLWAALAFGSGTRGAVLFTCLPVVLLFFLKHHSEAALANKMFSKKAYVVALMVGFPLLVAIQAQGFLRDTGFSGIDLGQVDVTKLKGNHMFSEGLYGYEAIPGEKGFFFDRFPGETLIQPIPQTIYQFIIQPIPRAIWTSKPIDPAWLWYNYIVTGNDGASEGANITEGMVGHWYIRYGLSGIIQGGLLVGFCIGFSERLLQGARGKTTQILFSLGLMVWLFRGYRSLNFHFLYPMLIGFFVMSIFIWMYNQTTPKKELG